MLRRIRLLLVCLVFGAVLALAQVGNGIITGTVTDQAGAVVAGVSVQVKNQDTGVVYAGATTATGNYTVADLPPGKYTLTVAQSGFKTYNQPNFEVSSSNTTRQDIPLQVGGSTESVTVTAESTLLKTESADMATNFTLAQLDELPVFGIGTNNAGTSGFRNPYATLLMLPGVTSNNAVNSTGFGFTVDGLNANMTLKIDGQEATNRTIGFLSVELGQAGLDSIQEVAYQTSNYSPEFGQAGTVVVNMTMKGGTNQYHGSGYDYFVNEDLNAGDPFSTTGCIYPIAPFATTTSPTCAPAGGSGGKYRPRNRRNDFGGTLGGPVYIPKIYNGHNKTFFFWSYEEYLEKTQLSFSDTVPTPDYLAGNFGKISPNGSCSLCSQLGIQKTALGTPTIQLDALGNQFFANTIYDPSTRGINPATNLGYATPFVNNVVPASRLDPLYVKVQGLINSLGAVSQNTNLTGNYNGQVPSKRYSAIPSIKIDHNLDAKDKLSFYYSENNTESQISTPLGNADGLPLEIGGYRGTFPPSWTYRLNYDRTLTPTLLLHLGVGYLYTDFSDHAPFLNFDPSAFGLTGFLHDRQFPTFTGQSNAYGGMQPIGTASQIQTRDLNYKPTAVASATYIKGKHTYKLGADAFWDSTIATSYSGVTFTTSGAPTSQPFTPTSSFNGFSVGNSYASWMLGDYTGSTQTAQTDPRNGSSAWDIYLQDSWKVTRKLTLDYGLRWDLFTVQHEEYGRLGQFSESVINTNAGNHPGGTIYASNCNCQFYQKGYPYALGPRIGIAYQINPKTVFRAGWGLTYAYTENPAGALVSTNGSYPIAPGINQFVNETTPGFIQQPVWPVTDPSRYPLINTNTGVPYMADANANRPPRTNQFSLGFQREITRSFVMEATYVGNRAAWLPGFLGGAGLNHISAAQYATLGLYPYPGTGPAGYNYHPAGLNCQAGNDCDRALLSQALNSTLVIQKLASVGLTSPSQYLPYSGYPLSNTIASILRPYPQFGAIGPAVSPTGNSKYDSLQVKATKRFSNGLSANGFFTWAQGFTRAVRQEFYNPASDQNSLQTAIPPRTLNFNFVYQTPKSAALPRWANFIVKDWQLTGNGNYQSAAFLAIPGTPNAEALGTQDVYIPGTPLYLDKNGNPTNVNPLNDPKAINGGTQVVLNPAAWAACPVNTNCGATGSYVMKNFRGVRHPTEDAGIGRIFRIKERMNLQFRGDFVNIFNRTFFPNPSTTSPQNPITRNSLGYITSGFGTMSTYVSPGTNTAGLNTFTGRTGTLLMKFSF